MAIRDQVPFVRVVIADPTELHFLIRRDELRTLVEARSSLWVQICLVSASLAVPCAINAPATSSVFWVFFGNLLVAATGLLLSIFSGYFAWKLRRRGKTLLTEIQGRPRFVLEDDLLQPLPYSHDDLDDDLGVRH